MSARAGSMRPPSGRSHRTGRRDMCGDWQSGRPCAERILGCWVAKIHTGPRCGVAQRMGHVHWPATGMRLPGTGCVCVDVSIIAMIQRHTAHGDSANSAVVEALGRLACPSENTILAMVESLAAQRESPRAPRLSIEGSIIDDAAHIGMFRARACMQARIGSIAACAAWHGGTQTGQRQVQNHIGASVSLH